MNASMLLPVLGGSIATLAGLYFIWRGKREWITPVLSLAGFLFGFASLNYQLKRQYQNTIEANRIQAEARLKLDVYKEILARIELVRKPIVRLIRAESSLAELERHCPVGQTYRLEARSHPVFQCLAFYQVAVDIAENSVLLKDTLFYYQQALPRNLEPLKDALSETSHLLLEECSSFVATFRHVSGNEMPDSIDYNPSETQLQALRPLAASVAASASEVHGAITDLQVECQNFLLGTIFIGKGIPRRLTNVKFELVGCRKEGD